MTDYTQLSYQDLDRLSIRTGCETEANRQADLELKRRGYHFLPELAMWVLTFDIVEGELVIVPPPKDPTP